MFGGMSSIQTSKLGEVIVFLTRECAPTVLMWYILSFSIEYNYMILINPLKIILFLNYIYLYVYNFKILWLNWFELIILFIN